MASSVAYSLQISFYKEYIREKNVRASNFDKIQNYQKRFKFFFSFVIKT